MLLNQNCEKQIVPVLHLPNISFGYSSNGKRLFFPFISQKSTHCSLYDEFAVVYFSNFSINNNFSHFLHGLLRLFCALIDAKYLVWVDSSQTFVPAVSYSLWLDANLKINQKKLDWIASLGSNIRILGKEISKGDCVQARQLLYGSGCVKLLPPEKWFGYPGCRASQILPAFGHYMRQQHNISNRPDVILLGPADVLPQPGSLNSSAYVVKYAVNILFAVRDVGELTGRREILDLNRLQIHLKRGNSVIKSTIRNITFENLPVKNTIEEMADAHIFISVHGAGMTNMFFMKAGSAVIELIPHPLCHCETPDYFYGDGGYYHGSAIAQNIKHYTYCVPPVDTLWYSKPKMIDERQVKCSWKYLHEVKSIKLDNYRFIALVRKVKRDLIASGFIVLTSPIINTNPHANG